MKLLALVFLALSPILACYGTTAWQPPVTVTASVTPLKILSADTRRVYLMIQNKGNHSVFLTVDAAAAPGVGVEIFAGGHYEPYRVPSNDLFVSTETATSEVVVMWGK